MGHKKSKLIDVNDNFVDEPNCSKKGKKHKYFPEDKKNNINLLPKTKNQELALKYFKNKPIVVLSGAAGCGKSFISSYYACNQLVKDNYKRFIVTRNAIGIGKSIGFFPGDVNEKLSVWTSNILGFCKEFVGNGTVDIWMKGDYPKIVLQPTEVLRGQSYENSIILVEEAQQLSIQEIKCITTRVGKDSLLILAGDTKQRDIATNGLEEFCSLIQKYNIDDVGIVRFTEEDIVRSGIVKQLVVMFEHEGI